MLNPVVDRDLEAVCLRCLARDPQQRYASAAALADDLERWLQGEPLSVRPPSPAYLAWRGLRRNVRTAVWVILVGVLGGAAAAVLAFGPAWLQEFELTAVAYEWLPHTEPLDGGPGR